jgi:hypothetical protein
MSATGDDFPAPSDARLGAILVRRAGLPLRTLQAALDQQKANPGRQLGEILLQVNAIDAVQLAEALERQRQSRKVSLLGGILVRTANLPLRSLQEALDRQKRNPSLRLGEILIKMGAIEAGQLAVALERQKELRDQDKL